MLLIGVFAAILLWAQPADAEPITLTLVAIGISQTVAAAITTAIVTTVVSMGLSFVANALLKPSASGSTQPALQTSAPSRQVIENKVSVRQAAASLPIIYGKCRIGGTIFFAHAVDDDQMLLMCVALAGHECEAIDEVWLNDEVLPLAPDGSVTSGKYQGYVGVTKHLGSPDQLADADLVNLSGGVWTSEHRARGICYLAIRLWANPEIFSSLPNFSAVIRGKKDILDPRTGTIGYTANSALCFANYLSDPMFGRGVAFGAEVDQPTLIASANACDEDVPVKAGGTEKRYETNGALLSSLEPQEIMGRLLGAMHGRAPYDGEKWRIIAGVWQPPTVHFTDADLRAGPKIATLTSRREACNRVAGTYMGPDNNWQVADFPPIVSQAFKDLDGGLELTRDIELPLTIYASMAQRIAKIDLLKARQQIAASMPCKLSAWRAQAGDTVTWTSERYGWTAKEFEVASLRFELYTDDDGNPALGVTLELKETHASVYDWATDEESKVDPAPNTNLPDPFEVLPPTNLTVDEEIYATRDGAGVKARANLAWLASPDGFAELYQPQFRPWPSGEWVKLPRIAGLQATLNDLAPGFYEYGVCAVNVLGVLSPLVTVVKEITGLQAPPAAPTGLTVFASGGWGLLRWVQSPDLDVRIGGVLVVRWGPSEPPYYLGEGGDILGEAGDLLGDETSTTSWERASPLIDAVPGADTHAVVPLRTGTYLAKFRDSTGIYSEEFASVQTQQSSDGYSLLASLIEDPAFAGGKTNCSVSSNRLKLMPGQTSGLYTFSGGINLGAVHFVRVTGNIVASVVNNSALVDSDEFVDSGELWDEGVSGSEAGSFIEFRSTTDNPSGAPNWSAWARLESADLEAYGLQFRYQQFSLDTDYGLETSGLAVVVEERV